MNNFMKGCLVYLFTPEFTPFFVVYMILSVAYASAYGSWIWIFSIFAIIVDVIMQIKINKAKKNETSK